MNNRERAPTRSDFRAARRPLALPLCSALLLLGLVVCPALGAAPDPEPAAFWRERDPRYAVGIVHGYRALLTSMPSPVPEGEAVSKYYEANFAKVSQGNAYTWFQATMIAALAEEQPAPSLHRALSQPLYPQ
jgi:hypothetical protein